MTSFLALSLFSCTSTKGPKETSAVNPVQAFTEQLSQSNWQLVRISFADETGHFDNDGSVEIRLLFSEGNRLSGSTGTNLFMGSWQLEKPLTQSSVAISISPLGMTMMAAISEEMAALEWEIIRALEQVASIRLDDGLLYLYDSTGRELLVYTGSIN